MSSGMWELGNDHWRSNAVTMTIILWAMSGGAGMREGVELPGQPTNLKEARASASSSSVHDDLDQQVRDLGFSGLTPRPVDGV